MWENFLTSLSIMLNGMFGIFSVIILLTLIIILFQWCEKKFAKPEKGE
jgi:Na+-transporting methylmalonyl-CoA/oxaloacetate decarboxylase gamma subunit